MTFILPYNVIAFNDNGIKREFETGSRYTVEYEETNSDSFNFGINLGGTFRIGFTFDSRDEAVNEDFYLVIF